MYTPQDVHDRLSSLVTAIREDHNRVYPDNLSGGYAYTVGYFESFVSRVLVAYVPANRRHELIEMIDAHVNSFKEKENVVS